VDAGGEKLARHFAMAFGTQLVIAHKQRNYERPNAVECINLLSAVPLQDKTIWIVDDMIDTAGSVYNLINELATRQCREINVMVVHPVLSGPAIERLLDLKANGLLARLVVCDTVDCETLRERLPFLETIHSEGLSARIILTIAQDGMMSDMLNAFTPERYLAGNGQ
jgi:ribose-phosphate pyrophosphokinase